MLPRDERAARRYMAASMKAPRLTLTGSALCECKAQADTLPCSVKKGKKVAVISR